MIYERKNSLELEAIREKEVGNFNLVLSKFNMTLDDWQKNKITDAQFKAMLPSLVFKMITQLTYMENNTVQTMCKRK